MSEPEDPIDIAPPASPTKEDREDMEEQEVFEERVQRELVFGLGEHVYIPTALASFIVGNWRNESGPCPTVTIWYNPARGSYTGMLHSRSRKARTYVEAANLPELFSHLGSRLSQDTLVWRADR